MSGDGASRRASRGVHAVLRGGARHAALLLAAMGICLLGQLHPGTSPVQSVATARPLVSSPGDIRLTEGAYILVADPATGVVSVGTRSGDLITRLPLTALVGRTELPPGARTRLRQGDGGLVADTVTAGGSLLVRAVLTPGTGGLTVDFSAAPGPVPSAAPVFFSDGVHGLDLGGVDASWTADPQQPADGSEMIVSAAGRRPLTPPPLDLQWQVPQAGWFGVGLAGLPDASSMWLSQRGIAVDYPLMLLGRLADSGGGGTTGAMLHFPPLLVTLGALTPREGLTLYRNALVGRGDVPANPSAVPAWAWQPIVDTWGEQMAEHAERAGTAFTAAWVRQFVADWTRRYGTGHVTVVIDSRWEQALGEPQPDIRRFGGAAGMRRLIDDLHAQGDRVELWWPLWAHGVPSARLTRSQPGGTTAPLDPSAPGVGAQVAAGVRTMLGSGPGQLDADGLKLDWTYAFAPAVADPGAGWGVRLLHTYLAEIHAAAHAVRPDAVVETSAAAPQFTDVSDAVRLYDAWDLADWARRAEIVTATMPGVPVDGDGWEAPRGTAVAHAVAATTYGVPAVYFGRLWGDRTPVSAVEARVIGSIVTLSRYKGAGTATPLSHGDWRFSGANGAFAESFGGGQGLVVWAAPDAGGARIARVVAAIDGTATVPLPLPLTGRITARDAAGRAVTVRGVRGGLRITLLAGGTVTLTLTPDAAPASG